MNPGDGLERFAVRILNADTFELIASPAIADLQFESSVQGRVPIGSYIGTWKAIASGMLLDVFRAWQANADTILPLLLIQSAYYACLFAIAGGLGQSRGREVLAKLVFDPGVGEALVILTVVLFLPAVTVAGCFLARARNVRGRF